MVQMRSAMDGIPVMRAMITDFRTVRPDDPLARAVDHVLTGFQQDFPVADGDRLAGILTRSDLIAGLGRLGPDGRVGDVMKREFVTADPRDMLQTALARLQDCECHTLPVVHDGRLLGLVTADNLAEALMIQQALATARRSGANGRAAVAPRDRLAPTA
jgi:CBS-domain-containing membrane protein